MVRKQQIDALILGCTELKFIQMDKDYAHFNKTTKIHVESITKYCREN